MSLVPVLSDICFLDTIVQLPVDQGYWRVIPVLVTCSKKLRTEIMSRLPKKFRTLMEIMFSGVRRRTPASGLNIYINLREMVTKMYVTGVLSDYLTLASLKFVLQSQHYLVDIPVAHAKNWQKYFPVLSADIANEDMLANPFSDLRTPDHYGSGECPGIVALALNSVQKIHNRGDILTLMNRSKTITSRLFYVNGRFIPTYETVRRSGHVYHSLFELPLMAANLHSYIFIIRYNQNLALVRRFYDVFGARMPTTGAWDLLFFAALMDLDLRTLAEIY